MGAGETTAILYQAGTPNHPIQRALDLGCGAGTLALLLANQAEEVVGTDINPRAVALAQFNADINGIANATFRCGDTFEPAANERFDLILSQPPYYPNPTGPRANLTYLHGGPRGDELALRIIHQIPTHLSTTGRALIFTSWPQDREDISLEGMEVLELTTNRREIHGTRQSINIIQRTNTVQGWYGTFEVPADYWGNVQAKRIDELFANNRLLHQTDEQIEVANLHLTEGLTFFHEGSTVLLRGPAESLIGYTPIDEETHKVLTSGKTSLPIRKSALRRGFLTVD
jgi:methylase of polypeptide subunit release factors